GANIVFRCQLTIASPSLAGLQIVESFCIAAEDFHRDRGFSRTTTAVPLLDRSIVGARAKGKIGAEFRSVNGISENAWGCIDAHRCDAGRTRCAARRRTEMNRGLNGGAVAGGTYIDSSPRCGDQQNRETHK